MTDSLLAAAGILSPSLAGQALAMDYLEEEQQRQMTIKAANITLYHERSGIPYVINLIDTPGHVDFTGRVTRSLRAIDGVVVVVDAVEEVMVQTETVTRQALEERVRPLLYVNKIDRLVKEIKLTPDKIQGKLEHIIRDFNNLIEMYAEPQFKKKWKVNPAAGTVAFGSAKDRWGFTVKIAQKKGVSFEDIVKAYKAEDISSYTELCPLHEAILNMFVDHLPPPHVAQKYRIPKIWKGDTESEIGQAMINCDENGPIVMCISDVKVDPQAGIVGTGRLFSGTVEAGKEVHLLNARKTERIQEVCIYMAQFREIVGSLPCGNIPALLGVSSVRAGETVTATKDIIPFEEIRYVSEPVMTVAIEPKHPRDLPKLVDFMNKLSIEDPTLVTKIDKESGEYLISGMGQLHLEIATTWIMKTGLEVSTGKPIVIYRESIRGSAGPFEGKSPNKHNRVYFTVEPLDEEIIDLMRKGILHEYTDRKKVAQILREHGWKTNEARGVWEIEPHFNILMNVTRGAQYLNEVRDHIRSGFTWSIEEGPLTHETMRGVKVKLVDVDLHEDPIHRGAAQIIPATRRTFFSGFLSANPCLLEPIQKITVKCPVEQVGQITRIIASKRGSVLSVEQKEYVTIVAGELPASETSDLSEVIRSATGGRAFWGLAFSKWARVPTSLQGDIIAEIRQRKGLTPKPPKAQDFMER